MKNMTCATSVVEVAPVEFNPPKHKCKKCGDVIYSRRPGEFVSCSCGAISVDQTHYYSRYIGNREDFESVDDNNSINNK